MYSSQLNYVPLAWPFFSFLVGLFLVLVILIQVHALRFAYMRLGISSGAALLLLLASLLGSYINIPVASLPEQQMVSDQEISFFGVRYAVPVVVDWPATVIAVNVGGAVIPVVLSLYLLAKNNLWGRGLLATACVAAVVLPARSAGARCRHCHSDIRPSLRDGDRSLPVRGDEYCRRRLHQREPRHAYRRGPPQPRQDPRHGRTGCLHRRGRHLRRHFPHGGYWRC